MNRDEYIPCGPWDVIQATKKAVMLGGDDGDWIWAPRSVIKDGDELARGQKSYVWARQWWVEKEQLIFEEVNDENDRNRDEVAGYACRNVHGQRPAVPRP